MNLTFYSMQCTWDSCLDNAPVHRKHDRVTSIADSGCVKLGAVQQLLRISASPILIDSLNFVTNIMFVCMYVALRTLSASIFNVATSFDCNITIYSRHCLWWDLKGNPFLCFIHKSYRNIFIQHFETFLIQIEFHPNVVSIVVKILVGFLVNYILTSYKWQFINETVLNWS